MTARSQVVEAMAQVNHNRSPKCLDRFGDEDEGWGCRCLSKAEAQLDAALEVVGERAKPLAPVVWLLAVLRGGE